MGFNLLMTGNLTALNPYVIETYSNPEAIGVNQDPLGAPIRRLDTGDDCVFDTTLANVQCAAAATTPSGGPRANQPARLAECGGEPALQTWELGAPSTNFVHNPKPGGLDVCLNVRACGSEIIYDACTCAEAGCHPGSPKRGCEGSASTPFPNEMFTFNQTTGTLTSVLRPREGGMPLVVTADENDMLSIAPLGANGGKGQKFQYTADKQITGSEGHCLTASGSGQCTVMCDCVFDLVLLLSRSP
jgi:hypothetical protein